MTARDPLVTKLERLDHVVAVGDLHNMVSAAIWDADPTITPGAHFTLLAGLYPDHHALIIGQEAEPLLARPTCFVPRRGSDNLELWPRCDQAYWFRASFRKAIGHGAPPDAV